MDIFVYLFHHLSRFVLEPKPVLMNEQEQKLKDSESAIASLLVIFFGHVKLFVHAFSPLESFVFICVNFAFCTVIFLFYYWSEPIPFVGYFTYLSKSKSLLKGFICTIFNGSSLHVLLLLFCYKL